jgi:hypothetical protein
MSDVHLIDGLQLEPTSFGYYDYNGVWQPKRYTGAYGNNGFYLPFNPQAYGDSVTTTNLGLDKSGRGNNWTLNNFSVVAGDTNDLLKDSPTNGSPTEDTGLGGQLAGNYCTFNPLENFTEGSPATNEPVHTNCNLTITGSNYLLAKATIGVNSGKWYWETTFTTNNNSMYVGVSDDSVRDWQNSVGKSSLGGSPYYPMEFTSAGFGTPFGSPANGDVIGIALNVDAGVAQYFVNNTLVFTDNTIPTDGRLLYPTAWTTFFGGTTCTNTYNFGQRPFAYAAPAGFKCLNTANLPQPAIPVPKNHFNVVTYTGTHTYPRNIDVGFQPDFVWVKDRTVAYNHRQFDTLRGTKPLYSNTDVPEDGFNDGPEVNTLGHSDGFTIINNPNGTNVGGYGVNVSGSNIVSWNWKGGNSTVTNTSGTVTSQVRVNEAAGFSVVTYAGSQANNFTVGHGLNVQPSIIITKSRNDNGSWGVYYTVNGVNTNWMRLNTDEGQGTNTGPLAGGAFVILNSTTMQIGNTAFANSASQMVAYCWAEVPGYSKFGKYIGNGSADGTFVYTGFTPKFIMTKRTDTGGLWWEMVDSTRERVNPSDQPLYANVSDTEYTNSVYNKDLLSNGFKMRGTNGGHNASGGTYIYMAFAEHPFKTARAR